MKRFWRAILMTLTALSLILFFATTAMWLRSLFALDYVAYQKPVLDDSPKYYFISSSSWVNVRMHLPKENESRHWQWETKERSEILTHGTGDGPFMIVSLKWRLLTIWTSADQYLVAFPYLYLFTVAAIPPFILIAAILVRILYNKLKKNNVYYGINVLNVQVWVHSNIHYVFVNNGTFTLYYSTLFILYAVY